jgi:pyridoxamine 5'-phosphate oxidase
VNIEQVRAELQAGGLGDDIERHDPFELLQQWVDFAADAGFFNPSAMALSTVGADNTPSVRNVLMRGVIDGGLAFFTNHNSQKGRDLRARPFAEALFSWLEFDRQIRVRGPVVELSAEQSDEYFSQRPRGSQLAALASDQSQSIPSRRWLMRRYKTLEHDGDRWTTQRLAP